MLATQLTSDDRSTVVPLGVPLRLRATGGAAPRIRRVERLDRMVAVTHALAVSGALREYMRRAGSDGLIETMRSEASVYGVSYYDFPSETDAALCARGLKRAAVARLPVVQDLS